MRWGCRILALQVRANERRARSLAGREGVSGQRIHPRSGEILDFDANERRREIAPDDVQLDSMLALSLGRTVQDESSELPQFKEGRRLGSPDSALLYGLEQSTGISPKRVSRG